jgi:hypothetical protein
MIYYSSPYSGDFNQEAKMGSPAMFERSTEHWMYEQLVLKTTRIVISTA